MNCDICKKNTATIHIQEIVGGKKHSLHICEECAEKKGLNSNNINGMNVAEILYKLSSEVGSPSLKENSKEEAPKSENESQNQTVVCPQCGWNSEKLKRTGRVGCSECYTAFSEILYETITNIQRGMYHTGKHPKSDNTDRSNITFEILELKNKLDKCIEREEYEEAAKLRDQIKELEQKKQNLNSSEKNG